MKDNKRSYSGHDTERTFANKGQGESKRNQFRVVGDATKEKQVENNNGKHRKSKKKHKIIIVLLFIFIIVVSEVIFEFLIIPKGLYKRALIVEIVYEIIVFAVKLFFSRDEFKYSSDFDEPFAEGIINALKQGWEVLKRDSILHIFILIGVGVFVGGKIGEKEVISKVERAYKAAVYAINNEEVEILFNSGIQSPEMKSVLLRKEQEMVEKAQALSLSVEEQNRKMNLSQEDCDIVCFMIGEYDISKLENQDDINEVIKRFVLDQQKKERENVFDKPDEEGGAPTEVQETIANASEREKAAESFEEIEDILGEREDAYLKYPKATLAKLISNGYEMMALVLMVHGGNIESINYYYGQSILKDFEYLEYADISDANIKKRLMKITQKYEDIMYINSDWEKQFPIAMKLRDAFQEAANLY